MGEPRWDFYWASVDGKDASISVDLALRDVAPLRDKPHLLRVHLKMRAPNERGWPTREERPAIDAFEDALVETLVGREGGVHAARMFRDGLCSQHFYLPRPGNELEVVVGQIFAAFPDYEGQSDGWKDAGWSAYLDSLYPNEMGLLFMRTRGRIDRMSEAGVDLDVPEEIRHRIVFADASRRRAFEAAATALGFSTLPDGLAGSQPLGFGDVNRAVERLYLLAREHGGRYEDWTVPRHEERVAFHLRRAADEALFKRLVELDYDFAKTHTIDQCVVAASETAAVAIGDELKARGYELRGIGRSRKGEWIVEASKPFRLDFAVLNAESEELWRLARRHGAAYDGWGTAKE